LCFDYGTWYTIPCPGNLHFNPELSVCDYPENAGCVGGTGDDTLKFIVTTIKTSTVVSFNLKWGTNLSATVNSSYEVYDCESGVATCDKSKIGSRL